MANKIKFFLGILLGFGLVHLAKFVFANNYLWAYFYK